MAAKHPVKRPVTAREAAERFGVSPRGVRNVMAQPREQWLAEHSIERTQPWRALGMSRSSWYAKGKPMPAQLGGGGEGRREAREAEALPA